MGTSNQGKFTLGVHQMKGTLDRTRRHQACWRHQRRAHHGRKDWEVGAGDPGWGGALPARCPCRGSCRQHGGRAGALSHSQWNTTVIGQW